MPTPSTNKKDARVFVFIDNSNVFKRIEELNRTPPRLPQWPVWPKSYDPLFLAQTLTGNNRKLVKTFFYCCPPPEDLKTKYNSEGRKIYWVQMSYYEAVKKLKDVEVKYAYLTGPRNDLHEKNLDTQLGSDMQRAAFKDEYDVAILIAGDGDYQSSVQAVKDIGKRVELAYFKGLARMSLVQLCDLSRRIRRSFIKKLSFQYNEDVQ